MVMSEVGPDTYTVLEEGGGDPLTDLSKYTSTIECRDAQGTVVAGDTTTEQTSLNVDVDSNDEITCTITNSRNMGKLKLVKSLDPDDDPGLFDLIIADSEGAEVEREDDQSHDGMVMADVDPGTFTVSETGGTSTSLGDYTSTIECRDAQDTVVAGDTTTEQTSLNVDVDSNDEITCTITNSRNMGKLKLVKSLDPDDDPGLFDLIIADSEGAEVEREDDQSHDGMVMADVDPGTFTVSETGGTSTSLGDYTSTIECRDTQGTVVAGDTTTEQTSLNVDVDSNDEITCTIRNTRNTGKLKLVKSLSPTDDPGVFHPGHQ